MIGARVRALRLARSWTQSHLAQAAGVSLRTVQRLESASAYSAETLLAVAAALDSDARTLLAEAAPAGGERPLWRAPRRAVTWAALLAAPALVFVSVNLLRSWAGYAAPFDAIATLADAAGMSRALLWVSPPVLLGGPLAAVMLVLLSRLRVGADWAGRTLRLRSLEFRVDAAGVAMALAAGSALAILMAYLVSENLGHLVRAAARAGG